MVECRRCRRARSPAAARRLRNALKASRAGSGAISGWDTARSIDDKRDHDDEHQRRIDGMQAKGDGPAAVERAMRQHVLQSNLNERNAREHHAKWPRRAGEPCEYRQWDYQPLEIRNPCLVIGPPRG